LLIKIITVYEPDSERWSNNFTQGTGEQFFSPKTVEQLQQTILGTQEPDRFVQIPVYDYSKKM